MLGIAAIFYTACNGSKTEPNPNDSLTKQVQQEFGQLENLHKEIQSSHLAWVNEHATVMGKSDDSTHLRIEQQHLKLIEEDGQLVDKHKMMIQSIPAESTETRKMLEELHNSIARLESDLKKIQDDHVEMNKSHH